MWNNRSKINCGTQRSVTLAFTMTSLMGCTMGAFTNMGYAARPLHGVVGTMH